MTEVLRSLRALFVRSGRHEDGQGLAEYALILAFIAIVAIVALAFMGEQIGGFLSEMGSALADAH